MAINKKLIHFKNFFDFNSKKLSANETNTQYTLGIDGAVTNGSPDILYQSICYIKDTKQQWTHGQLYDGSNETDPIFLASPAASITEAKKTEWDNKMDKVVLAPVATSGNYNDLTNKPTIPASVTESTVSGWGFTKNTGTYSKPTTGIPVSDLAGDIQTAIGKANTALQSYTEQYTGTITGVSANGTSVATSGVANIPAASTSKYGVTKLSSATNSTSTTLAATPSAVKAAYDLANGKQDKLTSGTNIKTINGESILGGGDLVIGGGNVQAVDTGDVLDDVNVDYATTAYVDGLVGDINSVLESIINGGSTYINITVSELGTTDLTIEQVREIIQHTNDIYGDEYNGPATNFKYTFNNTKLATMAYQKMSADEGEVYILQAVTNNDEGELLIEYVDNSLGNEQVISGYFVWNEY